MMRAVVISLCVGLCCLGLMGFVTRSTRKADPDVSESHVLVTASDPLVPPGSIVKLQCQLDDGSGYLATALPSASSMLVITVTAADLNTPPRGPFAESCAHWQARHHVQAIS